MSSFQKLLDKPDENKKYAGVFTPDPSGKDYIGGGRPSLRGLARTSGNLMPKKGPSPKAKERIEDRQRSKKAGALSKYFHEQDEE